MRRGYEAAMLARDFRATYRDALRKIDPMSILEHYGAQNIHETEGKNGKEFIHSCLIDHVKPHHTNGDQTPSAALNADKLLYACWSWGAGDILWFIQEMEDLEGDRARYQALDILVQFIVDSDEPREKDIDLIQKIYGEGHAVDAPIPSYSKIILKPWAFVHPYMLHRGFNEETLCRYQIGYDDELEQITIPHFWQGKLVGYQKRRQDNDQWPTTPPTDNRGQIIPKYKNSKDFPKDKTIYNYDVVKARGVSEVIVVESVMSVLAAESWYDEGYEEFGNVLCTFGASVKEAQIEILKEFDSVVLMMDDDYAGWKSTVHLYDALKDFCRVSIITEELGKIDMADLIAMEMQEVFATRKPGSLVISHFRKAINTKRKE